MCDVSIARASISVMGLMSQTPQLSPIRSTPLAMGGAQPAQPHLCPSASVGHFLHSLWNPKGTIFCHMPAPGTSGHCFLRNQWKLSTQSRVTSENQWEQTPQSHGTSANQGALSSQSCFTYRANEGCLLGHMPPLVTSRQALF